MTKKLTHLISLLIFTLTIFVFAGCEKKEAEYVDKGLSVGFESASAAGNVSFSDYCAYKSEVSEFDINDVTLHFFIGGMFSDSIEHELECGRNFPSVKLYFKRYELDESAMLGDEQYFITEISDYVSEKYRWKGDQYKLEDGLEITIPSELFIGESGRIAFIVKGIHIKDPDNEYKYISSIWIFYTVDGNKVILSEKDKTSML